MVGLALAGDFLDLHNGQFGAKTLLFVEALAALHLERDELFAPLVLDDVGGDFGTSHGRSAQSNLPIAVDEQNTLKGEKLSRFDAIEAIDFQGVSSGDAILLSACFHHGIHSFQKRAAKRPDGEGRVNVPIENRFGLGA